MKTNNDLVEEFAALLARSDALWDEQAKPRVKINDDFVAVLKMHWTKISPRKKFVISKAKDVVPEYDTIKAEYQNTADALLDKQRVERKEVSDRLQALAEEIVLADEVVEDRPKSEWSLYGRFATSDYSTQGFGASKYARSSSQGLLDHIENCGVKGEIREVKHEPYRSCGWSMDSSEFPVYACCSPTICEIIRRKPGLTLREHVKRFWKSGSNPRVMYPFLKPGYEESVGLDYFGNEKKKEVTA